MTTCKKCRVNESEYVGGWCAECKSKPYVLLIDHYRVYAKLRDKANSLFTQAYNLNISSGWKNFTERNHDTTDARWLHAIATIYREMAHDYYDANSVIVDTTSDISGGAIRKIDFNIIEKMTDAFMFGTHYVFRGDMVLCPLGDNCPGFPRCHQGLDCVGEVQDEVRL